MNSLEMIIKYWAKSKKEFWLSFLFQTLSTIFTIMTPVFIAKIVGVISPESSVTDPVSFIWINIILIIIVSLLTFLTNRLGRIKGAQVGTSAVYFLRNDINKAIYRQSFSYFDKQETGQLIARATSDVEQTNQIFGFGLLIGLQSFIQLMGVISAAIITAPGLIWIFLAIPLSILTSIYIAKRLRPIFIQTREAFGELTNTLQENIVGADVVRIFSKQGKENNKFRSNNSKYLNASIKSGKYYSAFMPINLAFIGFMIIAVLIIGGNMIINGSMDIDTLVMLMGFIGVTMFPLVMFGQIIVVYIQADAALVRIREVLESNPEIIEDPNPISIKTQDGGLKGDIEFKNVTFGYTPSNLILKDISFRVAAGEKLAILGTTGSGKSTIINLLPRFYDVNSGKILIDGIDIRKFKLDELRRSIGVVSQETFLFNKSIKENISFGKDDATLDEIIEAARIADMDKFIESLPEKYDTIVGERGTRLSGGQKQRLSIARAVLIKPKILIFDDSTSSVDVETEYHIQQALEHIMKNTTTLIITQRLSTIRNADKILLLDQGRIIGLGVHEELFEKNALYRQIYETLHKKQSSATSRPAHGENTVNVRRNMGNVPDNKGNAPGNNNDRNNNNTNLKEGLD